MNLALVTVHKSAEAIQGRKLFKGGNYSRKYGIGATTIGSTVTRQRNVQNTTREEDGKTDISDMNILVKFPASCTRGVLDGEWLEE